MTRIFQHIPYDIDIWPIYKTYDFWTETDYMKFSNMVANWESQNWKREFYFYQSFVYILKQLKIYIKKKLFELDH